MEYALKINTILHTKDGSRIGNAIVTGVDGCYWEVTTDYGNKFKLTIEEIEKNFNIAWSNFTKERDMYSCEEMQEMMSSDHKHRVKEDAKELQEEEDEKRYEEALRATCTLCIMEGRCVCGELDPMEEDEYDLDDDEV